MENHRLNWAPQANCHQCKAFELERQQEKEANAKSQRSAQTKKNHLAQRFALINKRKKQHNDCFHADLDTLEREVSQYQQRYNHIIPTGWTFKSYFERPSGPLAPGLERFYARGNPNRLINGFDLL